MPNIILHVDSAGKISGQVSLEDVADYIYPRGSLGDYDMNVSPMPRLTSYITVIDDDPRSMTFGSHRIAHAPDGRTIDLA